MSSIELCPEERSFVRSEPCAIFVSLELSRSTWLITSLSPGGGQKMSRHQLRSGDVAGLLSRLSQLREKCRARTGQSYPLRMIHEAGLDGFWIHRLLQKECIESHVVDPASIATSRRRRRAKTDGIDGEALVRALQAFRRGEPRVCAMVTAPTPEEEDRVGRSAAPYRSLTAERVAHVNRIKGLLFAQGIAGYEPIRRDRRDQLETVRTGDGRPVVRTMLYIAALHASRLCATFRVFRNRLTDAGKPIKVVLTATAHKLLGVLNAMLASNTDFQLEPPG